MGQIILTTASTSPLTIPTNFSLLNHKVHIQGSGGNGGAGTTGTTGTAGGGGGAGGHCTATYSSGTITPGVTTVDFLVGTGGGTNQTQWESSVNVTGNFYFASAGGNGAAAGTAGTPGSAGTTGSPTIVYTTVLGAGGTGGTGGGSNSLGGGGGGGCAGIAGATGGLGGSPTSTGGGGGGGGGVANAGGNPGTSTGGTGGNGTTGSGGTGAATGNPGTGSSGGGGGNGGAASVGGQGGSGTDFATGSGAPGCGGGGGGSGGKTTTTTVNLTGGNGGNYGGGGGGTGCLRTSGGTITVGTGGAGAIAVQFTSIGLDWDPNQWNPAPLISQPKTRQKAAGFMRGSDGTEATFQQFFPAGWEFVPPPTKLPKNVIKLAALKHRIEFVGSNSLAYGWEIPSPQPPHPRPERAGGIMKGDEGTQATFQRFFPSGWVVQPPQPPHPVPEKRASGTMRGDNGTEFPFTRFFPSGWEQVFAQPPHRRPEKSGGVAKGDEGIEAAFTPPATSVVGWGWQFEQPLTWHRYWKSPEFGDSGIQATFQGFFPSGWEQVFVQPPHPAPERHQAIEWLSQFNFYSSLQWGFDAQPPQPPHPRPERSGGLARGEDGTEAVFIPPVTTPGWGFQLEQSLTRHQFWKSPEYGDQGIEATFQRFFASGWEVQPPQPPHPRPERSGSVARGDDGTEFPFTQFFPYGWPIQLPQPPKPTQNRGAPLIFGDQGIEASFQQFFPSGWEIVPPQPPHPRRERAGSLMRGPDGTDFPFVQTFYSGWEVQPPPPPNPHWWRSGAFYGAFNIDAVFVPPISVVPWGHQFDQPLVRRRFWKSPEFGDQGTEFPFVRFFPAGWEVQPPQPPHPRPERSAALIREPEGTDFPLVRFFPFGWPVQPWQPPHPRPERGGAIMFGDAGIENTFIFTPTSPWFEQTPPLLRQIRKIAAALKGRSEFSIFPAVVPYGWDFQHPQLPHPRPERAASWMLGESGIELPFVPPTVFVGWGFEPIYLWKNVQSHAESIFGTSEFAAFDFIPRAFENQAWQPPHLRPERSGAIMVGDQGTYSKFVPPTVFAPWFETVLPSPPHPRRERAGILFGGDLGIQFPLVRFLTYGWPIQPWQPPHRRFERAGAIMVGDQGILLPFFFPFPSSTPAFGPTLPLIPHRRVERAGAIMVGDQGIQSPFYFLPPVLDWNHFPWQPFHIRPERSGGWMVGHQGIDFPFIPPPPFVTPPSPLRRLTGKTFVIDATPSMIDRPMYVFGPMPRLGESCSLIFVVGPGLPMLGGRVLFTFVRPDGTITTGDPNFAFIGSPTVTQHYIPNFLADQYLVYNFGLGELNQRGLWKVSAIAAGFFSNTYSFTVV